MKAWALALAALLAVTPAHAGLRRVEANVHAYSVFVQFLDGGHCTGTKVKPAKRGTSEILIAAHCVESNPPAVLIDQMPIEVTAIVPGPGDQARVTLAADLGRYASIGDPPKQGDEVFIFGNPGDHRDQLRRGYVSGVREDGYILAQLPIWKGDSGSAVFNERGQIVAIVSAITGNEFYPVAVLQPVAKP